MAPSCTKVQPKSKPGPSVALGRAHPDLLQLSLQIQQHHYHQPMLQCTALQSRAPVPPQTPSRLFFFCVVFFSKYHQLGTQKELLLNLLFLPWLSAASCTTTSGHLQPHPAALCGDHTAVETTRHFPLATNSSGCTILHHLHSESPMCHSALYHPHAALCLQMLNAVAMPVLPAQPHPCNASWPTHVLSGGGSAVQTVAVRKARPCVIKETLCKLVNSASSHRG